MCFYRKKKQIALVQVVPERPFNPLYNSGIKLKCIYTILEYNFLYLYQQFVYRPTESIYLH